MKYLSFDIEATGLEEHDYIIEFGMVPFCAKTGKIETNLQRHFFIKCPSFESLKPNLNKWVIDHNENLINQAHTEGISLLDFKNELVKYLEDDSVKKYFNQQKITLFGKSMSAIDLPFLNRDLGFDFMRKYFVHRQLDLSSVSYNLIDLGYLPPECESGNELMKFFNFGAVAHTALEDAVNTAKIYLEILTSFKHKK